MAYTYQEYPAWARTAAGDEKLVQSAEEFAALGEGWALPVYVAPDPKDQPGFQAYPKWVGDFLVQSAEEEAALFGNDSADDRAALIQTAEEKGVKIDKRWSDEKIRAAIEGA